MNNDILPPNNRRPNPQPQRPPQSLSPLPLAQPLPKPVELELEPPVVDPPKSPAKMPSSRRKWLFAIIASIIGLLLAVAVAAFFWYQQQLEPVASDPNAASVRVEIKPETTPDEIGSLLEEKKVIRSKLAFTIYTRLDGSRNSLKAGTFNLSPLNSTAEIVDHLVTGKSDEFSLTFLPGATLAQTREVLVKAGYSQSEIDAAFEKPYTTDDSLLFQDKPATADLEGYIYGETYNFDAGATVEQILKRTFEEYYKNIQKYDLITGLKTQGLNLYQGITLASIVQREVAMPSGDEPSSDQKQVAQVFLSRLSIGMMLGSDVTYQYAADKLNVERDTNLDSPYNTRRYVGLPPGPIASPGITALRAVAAPASGDYLFFLSGDDDVTYFGRTDAEHQENIKKHCAKKCSIL